MKKIVGLILCFLLTALCAFALASTEGDFEYSVVDGKAEITSYTGTDTEVIIPDSLRRRPGQRFTP